MRRLDAIKQEEWESVAEFNKNILEDFLTNSTELSPKSRKAYESNLKIWFIWVKTNLNNKKQIEIKPLEYKRFQNWLVTRGCSSSDVNNKRAAISSLNGYIEIYYNEEYPMFRNFINKSIKRPAKKVVREKEPLTKDEFNNLVNKLEEMGEYQKLAYILFTFETGCRREASRQLLKSVVDAVPIKKQRIETDECGNEKPVEFLVYQTHPIREKGAGEQGKIRRLTFGERSMEALKKWIEVRGNDDCPFMFVSHYDGKVKQVSETTFNMWTKNTMEPIVGRRFTPHCIRYARATIAVVEESKNIEQVKNLLGHESSVTTANHYIVRHDEDDVEELF